MVRIIEYIDGINRRVGELIKWMAVGIVCLGVFEVIMRYVFNRPTQWGYEMLLMSGAAMYALSWGYIQQQRSHVRIDIVFNHLSPKAQRHVEIIGTLVCFLPLMGFLNYMAFARMWRSWAIGEKSIETTWYPPLGPLRTAVFLGILLFTLQGIAQLIRLLHTPQED